MWMIITGPTASGKTKLAERLVQNYDCKIINGDVAQMYSVASIGTAKPEDSALRGELFDVVNDNNRYLQKTNEENKENMLIMSAVKYREIVKEEIVKAKKEKKIPIIVGGSLYYLKNLFVTLQEKKRDKITKKQQKELKKMLVKKPSLCESWKLLKKLDKERAQEINENDKYRIMRALKIIAETGMLASNKKEEIELVEKDTVKIIAVVPTKKILEEKIRERLKKMLEVSNGWIEEAENLMKNKKKQKLVEEKKFIGYEEIFNWIANGKKEEEKKEMENKIFIKTQKYAKRQITFWRGLKRKLEEKISLEKIEIIEVASEKDIDEEKIKGILELKENFDCLNIP